MDAKPYTQAFYVLLSAYTGKTISFTLLATLRQMATAFQQAINEVTWTKRSLTEFEVNLEALYADPKGIEHGLGSGALPYPPLLKSDKEGMAIELQ